MVQSAQNGRDTDMAARLDGAWSSGLVLAAISGASQATPIAPLSAGVVSDVAAGNVTQVHACG